MSAVYLGRGARIVLFWLLGEGGKVGPVSGCKKAADRAWRMISGMKLQLQSDELLNKLLLFVSFEEDKKNAYFNVEPKRLWRARPA